MRILTVANHKGGTGKTATTRTLGDVLARKGYKVLLVDLDPQSSLTTSCGYSEADPNLTDVIGGSDPGNKTIKEIILHISDNLDLAPSILAMAKTEIDIYSRLSREYIVKKMLEGIANKYDLCLIDCPPSLSLLVINALAASEAVLVPTQPMPIDIAGVKMFLETINIVRDSLNPDLSILGILPTFYDDRLNTHKAGIKAMNKAGWPVLPVMIGRSVRVGESAALGESIITFEPGNPQAAAYEELGGLIELWLKKTS